ncbi:transposase fragment [Streptococcus milleri]|nr:transposase fragment [Streptococcus milleri]
MLKKTYSVKTKLACIEMKKAGKSNKVITAKVWRSYLK